MLSHLVVLICELSFLAVCLRILNPDSFKVDSGFFSGSLDLVNRTDQCDRGCKTLIHDDSCSLERSLFHAFSKNE